MESAALIRPAPQPARAMLRGWHLLGLLLMFLMFYIATAGASRAFEGPSWRPLWQAAWLGLAAGWLSGSLNLSAARVAPAALFLGAVSALFLGGGLGQQVAALLAELNHAASTLATTANPMEIEYGSLVEYAARPAASTGVVVGRVGSWIVSWGAGSPAFDPVAATIVWALAVWLLSLMAGRWFGSGREPLMTSLPALLLCVIPITYTNLPFDGIYLLLASFLLFVAAAHHDRRQLEWRRSGIRVSTNVGWEILKRTAVAAGGIVIVTALTPSLSARDVSDMLQSMRGTVSNKPGGAARAVGLRDAADRLEPLVELLQPGLPRDHLIGSGPELSEQPVMQVQIEGPAVSGRLPSPLPIYWRSLTYDTYTGRGWRSTGFDEERYQARRPALFGNPTYSVPLGHEVSLASAGSEVLYAAGEIVTVDHPFTVARRGTSDVFAVTAQHDGRYRVESFVVTADAQALRTANQDLPVWTERFLQLPNALPGRVRTLALELTATEPTAYDRAVAIERYLRRIEHSLEVNRPPYYRDVVDFFVFDERRGYCDYYATAMAVLSRAAGIPSRLATGYAAGEYDPQTNTYHVMEAQAHSWVELYFTGIGWVPFEPTAGQPSLDRSGLAGLSSSSPVPDAPPFQSENGSQTARKWWLAFLAPLMIVPTSLGMMLLDAHRLGRLTPHAASSEIFTRLVQLAARLGVPLERGTTPLELRRNFAESLGEDSGEPRRRAGLAQGLRPDVELLCDWINAVQFRRQAERRSPDLSVPITWRRVWLKGQGLALLRRLDGQQS